MRAIAGWMGAAAAWATLASAGAIRADEPPESGTVSGRVVDAEGRGVAGAAVTFRGDQPGPGRAPAVHEVWADGEGRFRSTMLEPSPPGVVRVGVRAEGYPATLDAADRVAVFPGVDTDLGAIRLDRGRSFVGRVVEADGTPRAGVAVDLKVYRHGTGHGVADVGPRDNPVTDADGRFRTPPLPVGHLSLAVTLPERQRAAVPRRPIRPGPGEEDVGEIRLAPDVPIAARVVDAAGAPLGGVVVGGTVGIRTETGADGRFVIRGLGATPLPLRLTLNRPGYAELAGWLVVDPRGLRFAPQAGGAAAFVASGPPPAGAGEPARDLALVLRPAGVLGGMAVDAETGGPVAIDRVVLSRVARGPDGATTLERVVGRSDPAPPGQFRIAFAAPGEYHLAVTAAGYRRGEVSLPPAGLAEVGGIVVRMQPDRDEVPEVVRQSISGTVTRDGRPVATGWVTLEQRGRPANAANAPLAHGRTVATPLATRARAAIRDGAYALTVPAPGADYELAVAEPGQAPTLVGPIALAAGEAKALDVAATTGGRIRGRVAGVPADWRGAAFVVAFRANGFRAEARVEADGSFALPALPPGEYGLKAGHDAYDDAETYPGLLAQRHPEAYRDLADPWRRAARVVVPDGGDVAGVEVAWSD